MNNLRRILPRRNTEVDTEVHGGRKKNRNSVKLRAVLRSTPWFIFFIALFLLPGCLSIMEKAGQVLDGSAFAQKTAAVYRSSDLGIEISVMENKNGEKEVIIAAVKFPMMKIRVSMPDEEGNFYPLSLEYLAGNLHGWNEYTLELFGAGRLDLGENSSTLTINEIDPVQISAGRIHRYDTRITGTEALSSLRGRQERIAALTEWMVSLNGPKGADIDDFEEYWEPFLLPETVSKRKRPEGWLLEEDVFKRAEDIRWNTGYTQRVFPEELWPVRDSATLLRDWEEALSWIYLEYEWENITELFSREIILQKIR